MTQAIDQEKLKAAAEHLEWVLKQYPGEPVVQGLLESLLPLIEDAKAGRVLVPVDRIPFAYPFAEGEYASYKAPNVGDAYAAFAIEMRGGLTEQDKKRRVEMEAYRKALLEVKS